MFNILIAAITFLSPLHIDLLLAGNFGEPRPNHFHGGLDIKTQGVEGKAVFSIGDGYVEKVLFTKRGYGNAVFIRHPEGYISVYGHLQKFLPQVAARVRRWQQQNDTIYGSITFSPFEFPVAKGQLIAVSGNTGGSFGPHVHLEIRSAKTGEKLDPLNFIGSCFKDTQPPRAEAVMLYPLSGTVAEKQIPLRVNFESSKQNDSYEGNNQKGNLYILRPDIQVSGLLNSELNKHRYTLNAQHLPIPCWGKIGVAIFANDYMEQSHNKLGVRLTELFVDGRLVFCSIVSHVHPSQNKQINQWGDFDVFTRTSQWFLRSYIPAGLTLPFLYTDYSNGVVTVDEERPYYFTYRLTDFFGNQSEYSFTVVGKAF